MAFSDLQLGLAGVGVAAVAAVWAYNKWQERSLRRRAEQVFTGEGERPAAPAKAAGDAPADPSADAPADAAAPVVVPRMQPGPDGRVEPVLEAAPQGEPREETKSEPPLELADPLIDCLVYLDPAQPVRADGFWPAQRVHLGTLEQRLRWAACDAASGQWRLLTRDGGGVCRRLCAALQLVDRSGALSEVQLSKYFIGLRQLAEDFKAPVELPKAADVLGRAHALDELCASVDWRIGINVLRAGDPALDGTGLRRLLESVGLRRDAAGLYRAEDARGALLFTLAKMGGEALAEDDASAPEALTLTVDVPRVGDGVAAFDRLLVVARQLALALPGELVDDQRTPLADHVLGAIRDKVREFQQKMAQHDMPPGGRRALRLYS